MYQYDPLTRIAIHVAERITASLGAIRIDQGTRHSGAVDGRAVARLPIGGPGDCLDVIIDACEDGALRYSLRSTQRDAALGHGTPVQLVKIEGGAHAFERDEGVSRYIECHDGSWLVPGHIDLRLIGEDLAHDVEAVRLQHRLNQQAGRLLERVLHEINQSPETSYLRLIGDPNDGADILTDGWEWGERNGSAKACLWSRGVSPFWVTVSAFPDGSSALRFFSNSDCTEDYGRIPPTMFEDMNPAHIPSIIRACQLAAAEVDRIVECERNEEPAYEDEAADADEGPSP